MSHLVTDATHSEPLHLLAAQHEDWIIHQAIVLLERRVFRSGPMLNDTTAVLDYLHLKLAAEPNEVFAVIFLDNQNQVIDYEVLFRGTIDAAMVYPRVVVQRTLAHNAASLMLAHQHPSGVATPSVADKAITQALKTALATIDVRVLDHIIVGKGEPFSFARAGLL